MSGTKGRPADRRETEKKVNETLGKHERGEPLTEHEWMIVQYALGGGCHACGGMRVAVAGWDGGVR